MATALNGKWCLTPFLRFMGLTRAPTAGWSARQEFRQGVLDELVEVRQLARRLADGGFVFEELGEEIVLPRRQSFAGAFGHVDLDPILADLDFHFHEIDHDGRGWVGVDGG